MVKREDGKQKALRIPLDYYKKLDRITFWKVGLAALALLGSLSMVAWGLRQPSLHYSPGPVSTSHAMWENRCDLCHLPFTPASEGGLSLARYDGEAADSQCQACHRGPAHSFIQLAHDVVRCGTCHREHDGLAASLVRISDQQCIKCHKQIDLHRQVVAASQNDPIRVQNVVAFSSQLHPAFRGSEKDPGKLKFSHRRHLAPGLSMGPKDRLPPLKVEQLSTSARQRYAPGGRQDATVQLNCESCHQLDSTDFGGMPLGSLPQATLEPRATGAYYRPIIYENQCMDCHPLNFEAGVDPYRPDPAKLISHRLTPRQIDDFLKSQSARTILENRPDIFTPSAQDYLPGTERVLTPSERDHWRTLVRQADDVLTGRCTTCHEFPGCAPHVSQVAPVSTRVPTVWLEDARFDHTAHRAMACRQCHAKDYLWDAPTTPVQDYSQGFLDNSDVLIPQINVCLGCHQSTNSQPQAGMARADCIECHRYHDGDRPLAGIGSKRRDAGRKVLSTKDDAAANWPKRGD